MVTLSPFCNTHSTYFVLGRGKLTAIFSDSAPGEKRILYGEQN